MLLDSGLSKEEIKDLFEDDYNEHFGIVKEQEIEKPPVYKERNPKLKRPTNLVPRRKESLNYVVVDFEIANAKKSSVCAVGIAVVKNGVITESFEELVKPAPFYFNKKNTDIHGITKEDVKNKPTFEELWNTKLKKYFRGDVIAYNMQFDSMALREVLDVYMLDYPVIDLYCAYRLMKEYNKDLYNYQLSTVCERYGIELQHHQAKSDALAVVYIINEVLNHTKRVYTNDLNMLFSRYGLERGLINQSGYTPFTKEYSSYHVHHYRKEPSKHIAQLKNLQINKEHIFYDKNILFDGDEFEFGTKEQLEVLALKVGATMPSRSVVKSLNYLIVDNIKRDSAKVKKAKEYIEKGQDLTILEEFDFIAKLKS